MRVSVSPHDRTVMTGQGAWVRTRAATLPRKRMQTMAPKLTFRMSVLLLQQHTAAEFRPEQG